MITDIYIPSQFNGQFIFQQPNDSISGLNRVNIFIGPNNSGKSRFLRALFCNDLSYKLENINFDEILNLVTSLSTEVNQVMAAHRLIDVSGGQINGVKKTLMTLKAGSKRLGSQEISN